MEYEITFSSSSRFINEVSKAYWLRHYWKGYFLYIAIPTVAFVLCFTDQKITSSQIGDSLMGFMAGIAATILLQFFYQLFRFQKLPSSEKTFELVIRFTEDEISYRSELVTSNYKWKAFKKLWTTSSCWVLLASNGRTIALPPEMLNDELKQFIAKKIIEVDGRVVH
jgi:hypothetical protein